MCPTVQCFFFSDADLPDDRASCSVGTVAVDYRTVDVLYVIYHLHFWEHAIFVLYAFLIICDHVMSEKMSKLC